MWAGTRRPAPASWQSVAQRLERARSVLPKWNQDQGTLRVRRAGPTTLRSKRGPGQLTQAGGQMGTRRQRCQRQEPSL